MRNLALIFSKFKESLLNWNLNCYSHVLINIYSLVISFSKFIYFHYTIRIVKLIQKKKYKLYKLILKNRTLTDLKLNQLITRLLLCTKLECYSERY